MPQIIKRILLILSVIFLLLFAASCTKNQNKLTVESISSKIVSEISFPKLIAIDDSKLSNHFNFSSDSFNDFAVYLSSEDEKADEYAVFELKEETDKTKIINAIGAHISNRSDSFKQLPNEFTKVENNVLRSFDNFVILIICGENEQASNILSEMGATAITTNPKNKP